MLSKQAQEEVLQAYIDKIRETEQLKRQQMQMTLGEFIEKLETFDENWDIQIAPFHLKPTGFESYRGYYEDLALNYSTESESVTVGDVLKWAKNMIGQTLTGYKGGEFLMNRHTVLWVSERNWEENYFKNHKSSILFEIPYRYPENILNKNFFYDYLKLGYNNLFLDSEK